MKYITLLKAIAQFVHNKLPVILLALFTSAAYRALPDNQPVPFAEVLYSVALILDIAVLAPFMRLLVFGEAAVYAESGGLDGDLSEYQSSTPLRYRHYALATIICYATALLCVSSLLS